MEVLRSLKDIVIYGRKPIGWTEWRRMFIEGRKKGVDSQLAPKMFYMSQDLLEVFDEMLPAKKGRVDTSRESEASKKALMGLEVARGLVVDFFGKSLLVQSVNDGDSSLTSRGSSVTRSVKLGEIGEIHTHPRDIMPSSTDIGNILIGDFSTEIIVTPRRVIVLFRSLETPVFQFKPMVEGYLTQMGASKSKIERPSLNKEENLWTVSYQDLSELKILGYEGKRGQRVFIRKTG